MRIPCGNFVVQPHFLRDAGGPGGRFTIVHIFTMTDGCRCCSTALPHFQYLESSLSLVVATLSGSVCTSTKSIMPRLSRCGTKSVLIWVKMKGVGVKRMGPKPGKDKTTIRAWRPINLINYIGKLAKKVVADELQETGHLHKHQFEARQRKVNNRRSGQSDHFYTEEPQSRGSGQGKIQGCQECLWGYKVTGPSTGNHGYGSREVEQIL